MIASALLVASLETSDRQFVDRAIGMNVATIERAQAAESSGDNYVLDYVEEVVGDRRLADQQLEAVARSESYASSRQLSPKVGAPATMRPGSSRLTASQSAAWGVHYFQGEVAANLAALSLYAAEAKSGSDPALRRYAQSFEPKLQGELQHSMHDLQVERSLEGEHP